MSQEFSFDIEPKDAASAIFMGRNHRALVAAFVRAKKLHGITQQQVAERMGVNKSVVSRALRGRNNLTERTLAELCWAIGVEPQLVLTEQNEHGANELDREFHIEINLPVEEPSKPRQTESTSVRLEDGFAWEAA